jgi:hypothetical protein
VVSTRTLLSEFVDGNDIGVVEGRGRAWFLLEAVRPITVCGKCGGQNLDRNNAIQARIPRPVYLAHPAGAQFQSGPADFRRDGLTAYRNRVLP